MNDEHSYRSALIVPRSSLQGDVAMLLRRILVALVAQHGKGGDQLSAREARLDDLVDVAALRSDVRIGELLSVLSDLRVAVARTFVQNADRTLRAHHRDLG